MKNLFKEIRNLSDLVLELRKEIHVIKDFHRKCAHCGIIGHRIELVAGLDSSFSKIEYYHKNCFEEKFNKCLCPCGCGKWINKGEK